MNSSNDFRKTIIHDLPIAQITEKQCIDIVISSIKKGKGGWIVTVNLHHLQLASKSPDYKKMLLLADILTPDGAPVLWAAALMGKPLPERVAGSNLIFSMSKAAAQKECTLFLLGGAPGTAEAAGKILKTKYLGLKIAGIESPSPGFENDDHKVQKLLEKIKKATPDILYVALGSPKTEYLIARFKPQLPYTWCIGVGISFSFVSGHVKRAPRWMQRFGLEWLHRLSQEPYRLAERYLLKGIPFFLKLTARSLQLRLRD